MSDMSERATVEIVTAMIGHEDRFWSKVDRTSCTGCWPWTAATTRTGKNLGSLRPNFHLMVNCTRRTLRSSRIALILETGLEYVWLDVGHSDGCTTTLCCRPSHLSWVTKRQNIADYWSGRRRRRWAL